MVVRDRKNRGPTKSRRRKDALRTKLVGLLKQEPDGLTTPQLVDRLKTSGWKHIGSPNEIANVLRMTPGIKKGDERLRMASTVGSRNYAIWKIKNINEWESYIRGE